MRTDAAAGAARRRRLPRSRRAPPSRAWRGAARRPLRARARRSRTAPPRGAAGRTRSSPPLRGRPTPPTCGRSGVPSEELLAQVAVFRALERIDGFLRGVLEVARHPDLDARVQVTGRTTARIRHALSAQAQARAAVGAGRNR